MRIIFIGAVEFSRKALQQLVEMKANVVGVCTLEHSTFNADHCDLSSVCQGNDIPCCYASDINSEESMQWIADKRPDVIFCFGWSKLIRAQLLNMAPLGVVGFHPTALPLNRGRHPLIWALARGLRETAATFFFMDEAADRGAILSQRKIHISDEDNAASLYEKMTECALEQIKTFVPQLASGDYPRVEQDHQLANVWRKRGKMDGQIDWRMSARSIHNLTRALSKPYAGAHFLYRGQEIKVWQTQIVEDVPQHFEPGKICAKTTRGVVVKCGEQGILLLKTEPLFDPVLGEYL